MYEILDFSGNRIPRVDIASDPDAQRNSLNLHTQSPKRSVTYSMCSFQSFTTIFTIPVNFFTLDS